MKSKKIISGLLALTFVFGGTALPNTVVNNSVSASAATKNVEVFTYGDYDYIQLEDGTVEIAKYNGTDEVVEIPGEIDGAAVTSIGAKAFDGNKTITSVTIPEGVNNIGFRAFYDCDALLEMEIPDGVKTIGGQVFHSCDKLRKVTMTDSVEILGVGSLGVGVFGFCKSLESVTLSNKLTQINDETFEYCESLKEIKLPSGIKSIGKKAFLSCTNLESINLPDGLETINSEAFKNCNKITKIEMPDSVTSIGNSAFYKCTSLADVKLSANLVSIGSSAFQYCNSIESLEIPEGVKTIGGYFSCLDNLKSLSLPESLTSIGWGSFRSCKNLKELTVSPNLTNIGTIAFTDNHPDFVLNCYNASAAEKHALANGVNFNVLDAKEKTEYPELNSARFNSQYHQFRLNWTAVEGAEEYGIAVNLAGKWKVQAYTDAKTTTFTSPKLKSGSKYDMAICAKVNGKWETTDFTKRAFTIAVK